MKAMMVDLIVMKSNFAQLAGLCALISVVVAFVSGTVVTFAVAASVMVPFLFLFTVSAYDETNGWEQFRMAMPFSRREVVFGRYGSFLAVCVVSAILAAALALVLAAVARLLPQSIDAIASIAAEELPVSVLVGMMLMGSSFALVSGCITIPLTMRFGMTKGVRLVPVVVVFALVGLSAVGSEPIEAAVSALASATNFGDDVLIALIALIVMLAALVLYAASAALSVRLYAAREL